MGLISHKHTPVWKVAAAPEVCARPADVAQAAMAEILSCYCGACTLTITGEPAMQVYCHCSDCRKWGGSIAQVPAAGPSARDGVPSP